MKNKILKYDCLIIGSGLLGSLLAISLIKKQYKVLVLEKEGLSDGAFSDQILEISLNLSIYGIN